MVYVLLVRTLFLTYLAIGWPSTATSPAAKGVFTYTFRRFPVIWAAGTGPGSVFSVTFSSEVVPFRRTDLLKKLFRFFKPDRLRCARASARMDSAIVDAAVLTVRSCKFGSIVSSCSSSVSTSSGWTCRRRNDMKGGLMVVVSVPWNSCWSITTNLGQNRGQHGDEG